MEFFSSFQIFLIKSSVNWEHLQHDDCINQNKIIIFQENTCSYLTIHSRGEIALRVDIFLRPYKLQGHLHCFLMLLREKKCEFMKSTFQLITYLSDHPLLSHSCTPVLRLSGKMCGPGRKWPTTNSSFCKQVSGSWTAMYMHAYVKSVVQLGNLHSTAWV